MIEYISVLCAIALGFIIGFGWARVFYYRPKYNKWICKCGRRNPIYIKKCLVCQEVKNECRS